MKRGYTTSIKDSMLIWCILCILILPFIFVTSKNGISGMRIIYFIMNILLWLFISFFIVNYLYKKLIKLFEDGVIIEIYDIRAIKVLSLIAVILILAPMYFFSILEPADFNIANFFGILLFPSIFIGQEVFIGNKHLIFKSYIIEIEALQYYTVDLRKRSKHIKLHLKEGNEFTLRMNSFKADQLMKLLNQRVPYKKTEN